MNWIGIIRIACWASIGGLTWELPLWKYLAVFALSAVIALVCRAEGYEDGLSER